MPVFQLDERLIFPPPTVAEEDGLLAVGGDLQPRRLLLAYSQGIFPWPHDDMPLMWFSPDPRMVLTPDEARVSRSLRARLRRGEYEVTLDRAFPEVVAACADTPRGDQDGTWITDDIAAAYGRLHELGLAHSVETWHEGRLVGGLYGLSLGRAFFGESMFSRRSDASKVAFVTLSRQLVAWDFAFIDCQVPSEHLASLGAREWPRQRYLDALHDAVRQPTRQGPWELERAACAG